MVRRCTKIKLHGDPVIWGITFCLAILSILVVYSATSSLAYRKMEGNTEYYLIKHTSLMVASLIMMWIVHKIDYRYFAGFFKLALWISFPLLLITWRYGITVNEASRWMHVPIINKAFQPSDLAQLALISCLANILAKNQLNISEPKKVFIPILFYSISICGLIALTNFSGALILLSTCMLLMYFGRIPIKYLSLLMVFAMLIISIALLFGQRKETVLGRLSAFSNHKVSFQTEQSYIAIATGGIYGKGPGKSTQRNLLPYGYADFIYAILVEEYGLVGGITVMLLYLILLYRGMRITVTRAKPYACLLSVGLSFLIGMQALVNMGIAVGLGPVTGLQLPYISMGGTSLLFTGIALGMILSANIGDVDSNIDSFLKQQKNNSIENVYKTSAT